MQNLASFDDLSIGEEQSESRVLALTWSPEGLAKHKRCALAVLTTNLLLHVWASPTDPATEKSWRRVLVVNDAMEAYFQSRPQPRRADQDQPSVRRQKRIRAASWAPRPASELGIDAWSTTSALLAVLNDSSQIVLLEVSYESIDTLETSATVFTHFQLPQQPDHEPNGDLEEIIWSAWRQNGHGGSTIITCQQQGMNFSVLIRVEQSPECETTVDMSLNDTSRSTDAASEPGQPQASVHDGVGEHFDQALDDIKLRFSNRYNLLGRVVPRTWGACRWHDLKATLHTVHPSEQIEYTTSAHERAHVFFASDTPKQPRKFPWEDNDSFQEVARSHSAPFNAFMDDLSKIDLQIRNRVGDRSPSALNRSARDEPNAIDAIAGHPSEPSFFNADVDIKNVDLEFMFTTISATLLLQPELLLSDREKFLSFDALLKQSALGDMDLAGLSQLQGLIDNVMDSINRIIDSSGDEQAIKHLTRCQICEKLMLWKDPYTAQCAVGHLFSVSSLWSFKEHSANLSQSVAA